MARKSVFLLAWMLCAVPAAAGAQPAKPVCLTSSESREEIAEHHLLEPFAVLKTASTAAKAEALSAKLCRLGEEYVYEIALLDRHGRLAHLVMNAVTGKILGSRNLREPPPRT
jgi:hypothetical protein